MNPTMRRHAARLRVPRRFLAFVTMTITLVA